MVITITDPDLFSNLSRLRRKKKGYGTMISIVDKILRKSKLPRSKGRVTANLIVHYRHLQRLTANQSRWLEALDTVLVVLTI